MNNYNHIIEKLRNNEIYILPTDTIYGLCGIATKEHVVKKIYTIKQRDYRKSLTIFPESIVRIEQYVVLNDFSRELIRNFFPGNLTLVLRKKNNNKLSKNISQNEFLGIRCPNHPLLQNILTELDDPLIATSVNCSGESDINDADALKNFAQQHAINCILGERQKVSQPSTILKIDGNEYEFLRHYPGSDLYKKIMQIIEYHY